MTEQPTEDVEVIEMTPHDAIQCAIFDLCRERADWKERDDPNGVLPWIVARLNNLARAQLQLDELRKIKAALAVLKEVV